jgi:hypothetical protein
MIYRRNIDVDARDTFLITDIQASSVADKVIGILPVRCELVSVKEVHGVKAGQTCTVSIERLQGVETSASGDQVVAATINAEGTANTVQSGTIVTAGDINIFEAGDRVGVNMTGTTTSLATMIVACLFRPIDA